LQYSLIGLLSFMELCRIDHGAGVLVWGVEPGTGKNAASNAGKASSKKSVGMSIRRWSAEFA
jgi:hypothetical protein